MIKYFGCCFSALLCIVWFADPVQAENLIEIYQQAVKSDPIFAQAQSTWESAKLNLPIARAGYLPQVDVSASATRNYDKSQPALFANVNGYTWQYGYGLTATQPIFNLAVWSAISGASAGAKAATATYLAEQQSLMQRTAQAYFKVLQAYDELHYTIANKKAVWQQLVTARQKFQVGLIAITDVYDARSRYDQVVAAQIAAQNELNVQLENLRAITNRHYTLLDGLGNRLPLLKPRPANINQWVSVANQQNYSLKAQNYTVMAAMDAVKQQAAGNYPNINVEGNVTETHVAETPNNSAGIPGHTSNLNADLGLSLSYAPIQGGLVHASTKQAKYNYETASSKLEEIHRNVVKQARSSYLSVMSGISQITADKQRIVSARNALSATEAGFKVGTRTMVDVLNDMTTLYQAQQQYANDQYAYINYLIALKVAAGTLSVSDLQEINGWLTKRIQLPKQTELPIDSKPEVVTTEQSVKKAVSTTKIAHKRNRKSLEQSAKKLHKKTVQSRAVVLADSQDADFQTANPALELPTPADTH